MSHPTIMTKTVWTVRRFRVSGVAANVEITIAETNIAPRSPPAARSWALPSEKPEEEEDYDHS